MDRSDAPASAHNYTPKRHKTHINDARHTREPGERRHQRDATSRPTACTRLLRSTPRRRCCTAPPVPASSEHRPMGVSADRWEVRAPRPDPRIDDARAQPGRWGRTLHARAHTPRPPADEQAEPSATPNHSRDHDCPRAAHALVPRRHRARALPGVADARPSRRRHHLAFGVMSTWPLRGGKRTARASVEVVASFGRGLRAGAALATGRAWPNPARGQHAESGRVLG